MHDPSSRGIARRVLAPSLKILRRALAAVQNFWAGGCPDPPGYAHAVLTSQVA